MNMENRVRIDITGLMSERFINIASSNGAKFFDVVRKKNCVSATVSVKHIKNLRKAARLSGCKVKIYDRSGPKFAARRMIRRFMLPIGFVLAAALVSLFLQHTWVIELEGNEKLSDEYIMELLSSYDIRPGMLRKTDELRETEQQILLENGQLTYIGLKTKGIVMTVRIAEAKASPEIYNPKRRGDIVAAYDAVIESLSVFAGTAQVKVGDTVKKGQVIISGSQNGQYVCALGEVAGSVWYQGSGESPLFTQNQVKTGRESVFRHFKTPMMYVIITEGEEFAQYEVNSSEVGLLDGLFLGISVITEIHCETVTEISPVPYDEAKQLALNKAYERLLDKLPLGLIPLDVTESYSVSAENASATAAVQARVLRDIGKAVYYD